MLNPAVAAATDWDRSKQGKLGIHRTIKMEHKLISYFKRYDQCGCQTHKCSTGTDYWPSAAQFKFPIQIQLIDVRAR